MRKIPHTAALLLVLASAACGEEGVWPNAATRSAQQHEFTAADNLLLDKVQRGCFDYLWNEVGRPAGLVVDRLDTNISSVAGVGFQLSALPIGVERGWVSRNEARTRAESILRALVERGDNKRFGVYLHFVDQHTGGLRPDAPQIQASTVDHALLQAGAMTAASYFGGDVRKLADQIVRGAQWQRFSSGAHGYLSFGWRPDRKDDLHGPGAFRPWKWRVASAEEQLTTFMAVASPVGEHAVPPEVYYHLVRVIGAHNNTAPYSVSWNGSMFTYFFQNCWIDYGRFEPDNPSAFGVDAPRVDWFENTRRAFLTHRRRCMQLSATYTTLGRNRWGLGPCLGLKEGGRVSYLVQDMLPNQSGLDLWREGTVAPYVTGSAMPFLPRESLAALREMMELRNKSGEPLVWRDPATGGYGFLDSFNLEQNHAPESYIAIDVGPMLLSIENARTGLIWKLFHEHPTAQLGAERLAWQERNPAP